jgi:hypothetical protein
MAKMIAPFIGGRSCVMSEIGCSFPPHKPADENDAFRERPDQSHPSTGSKCAWRRVAAGVEAVFEFEEGEGTHILTAVGRIRDRGEKLPALSGIAVPDEIHLRIEAIEDPEVVAVNCSNRRYTRTSRSNSTCQRSRQVIVIAQGG